MSYLSSNQLKQYKDEGFISPINIFSKKKAKEIREEIELIENKIPGELEKSGRYNAHLISPLLDEITHNSKILDAVESVIGKDILAGFKNIIGGELKAYTELLSEARNEALNRMLADASARGANGVVNVRFATSSVAGGAAELFAYGTAVVVQ